jgi:hypothetical protein
MEEYRARLGRVEGKNASGKEGVVGVLADFRFRSIPAIMADLVVPLVPVV